MLVVDVVLLVILLIAVIIGLQRGLLASLGTLVGLAVGGLAAFWLLPMLGELLPWREWRGLGMIVAGILLLAAGAGLGAGLGAFLRRGVDRTPLRAAERLLGGVASGVVAALALSFVGSGIAVTGIPVISSAVASSQVLRVITEFTPRPVTETLAQVRGALLDQGLPTLGDLLAPGLAPAAPPVALDDPALAEAAESVARITGIAYACGISSTGTGFVIAPDRIVTNAHVVAGVDQPVVELPGEAAREGRIVYFDPIDDLAVIAVDDLGATPLPVVPTLAAGSAAVVQGYPFGGPFTSTTASVLSVGTAPVPDIYREQSTPREVYSLAAPVRPGNSGGPLLTADGSVAGVVFARGADDEDRGYAMTTAELMPVLAQASSLDASTSSGRCAD